MSLEVLIFANLFTNFNKSSKESVVIAVIEALTELLQVRDLFIDGENIWWMDDFFLDSLSVFAQDAEDHWVENESFEVEKFDGGECCYRWNEEVRCFFQVSDEDAVNTFVNLKLILFVPISSIFNEFVACVNVLLDLGNVLLLKAHK